MRRLSLCLGATTLAALVCVAAATAAGGPLFTVYGGTGVATHDGAFHWVTIADGSRATLLERIGVANGVVSPWTRLEGSWGIPSVGALGQGLSRDGRTLVLAANAGPYAARSKFLVLSLPRMKVRQQVTVKGSFSYDALSPDGSRLYLIQYVAGSAGDFSDYVVRAYDLRRQTLLPGKIVDRKEKEESMAGSPVTRVTSADGRWVYTLYEKPSGEPFVHALDTVTATAHCLDLTSPPNHAAFRNPSLALRGRTLAVNWRGGRPFADIALGTWRVSRPASRAAAGAGAGFPGAWVGGGIGGGLALLSAGGLLLWRRRGQEVEEEAREELGLAERHVVV
jgi:hypothetical protein